MIWILLADATVTAAEVARWLAYQSSHQVVIVTADRTYPKPPAPPEFPVECKSEDRDTLREVYWERFLIAWRVPQVLGQPRPGFPPHPRQLGPAYRAGRR